MDDTGIEPVSISLQGRKFHSRSTPFSSYDWIFGCQGHPGVPSKVAIVVPFSGAGPLSNQLTSVGAVTASSRSSTIALFNRSLCTVRWASSSLSAVAAGSVFPLAMVSTHGPSSRSKSARPCRHVNPTQDVVLSGMGVCWQRLSLATVLARLHPMPNQKRATNPPPQNMRFQCNWLLTANGWVFEPIWWDQ